MKGQSSVKNRIIWAFCMVVLCTFLTFFMSMFLGSAFPDMNLIYRAGIPALILVVLGIAAFGLQNFFIPFLNELSIPEGIRKAIPVIIIALGIMLGQFSYDEFANAALQTDVFQNFMINGNIYESGKFGFESIYQSGLNVVRVLLGNTVFAVSIYNRIYLVIAAIFMYFALKNICSQKTLAANLFLIIFFCAKHTMELAVKPEATLVYVLLVALFFFNVSLVYYYRTRTHNLIAQVISVFVMGCLFAVLFIIEANSLILALPAILVAFSGKDRQDGRWYYILAVEGLLLIMITCVVVLVSKPEILLNFSFDFPSVDAVNLKSTTLLVLNVIGFLGIYGMAKQKLYYALPALMGVYYMFAKTDFVSGVNGEFLVFMCFALYASLGVGLLDESVVEEIDDEAEENDILDDDDNVENVSLEISKDINPVSVNETQVNEEVSVNKEEQEEIATIKAMNDKLNKVEAGFVPLTFKGPKPREKKSVDYAYEPTLDEMKYDIDVADDDDFDI